MHELFFELLKVCGTFNIQYRFFFSLSRVKIGLHRSDSQNRKFDSVIILSANSYTFFREVGLSIFWMAQI